jgi:hypothetical protein
MIAARAAALVVVVVVAIGLAATARAAEPPPLVRLVHVAGTGTEGACPGASGFEDAVTERLGRSPFSDVVGTLLVVLVERDGHGFRGRMFVRREDGETTGERRLQMASCDRLVRSLAVAAGVLLGSPAPLPPAPSDPTTPEEGAAPGDGEPSPVLAPPPAEKPPAPAAATIATTTAASRPVAATSPGLLRGAAWQLSLAPVTALGGTRGTSDTLVFGGAAAVAMVWSRAALGLEMRVLPLVSELVGRGEVRTGTIAASVLPCLRWRQLVPCASLTGGLLQAGASGFDQNFERSVAHLAAGGRLGVELGAGAPAWPVRVRPTLWFEVPFTRWTFTVDGADVVRRTAVTTGLALEVVLHLP